MLTAAVNRRRVQTGRHLDLPAHLRTLVRSRVLLAVGAFNLLGDGLRDVLDPRLRPKH
ncbi:MAG TPA: hypothetical protein VIP07_07600 [Candidatus Limnocylindria bacterium]